MEPPRGPSFATPIGLIAVLDSSVLVRGWLSPRDAPNPARRIMLLAGVVYDSFTSPAIIAEVEDVLGRPRIGADTARVRRWVDAFLRSSRQVFPESIPGTDARAIRGDAGDLPILHTAYAVTAAGNESGEVLTTAQAEGGCFLVSENTKHFVPGMNVYGWRFITAHEFWRHLQRRGQAS